MLEAEWGSSAPVSMAKSFYDEGEPRRCQICDGSKSLIIGRNAYQWICTVCDDKMSERELLTKAFLKNLVS